MYAHTQGNAVEYIRSYHSMAQLGRQALPFHRVEVRSAKVSLLSYFNTNQYTKFHHDYPVVFAKRGGVITPLNGPDD